MGFQCFLCKLSFDTVKLLKDHLLDKRIHQIYMNSAFTCVDCKRDYTSSSSFTKHLTRDHPGQDSQQSHFQTANLRDDSQPTEAEWLAILYNNICEDFVNFCLIF